MSARQIVKDLLPPVAVRGLRRAINRIRNHRDTPEWEYRPNGWRDDEAGVRGWNAEGVVESQRRTWSEFVRLASENGPLGLNTTDDPLLPFSDSAHNTILTFGYVLALTAQGKSEVSLLDWGGGMGHYAVLARSLLPEVTIRYHCKDMPLLVAAGKDLLPNDTFYSTDDECERNRYDLVMASGSIHYSRDWQSMVSRLGNLAKQHLYFTRVPIVRKAASFVVMQRPYACGFDTEYVGWFLNRAEFLDCARNSGLYLIREFLIQEQPYVPGAPEQCRYGGFLFRSPS